MKTLFHFARVILCLGAVFVLLGCGNAGSSAKYSDVEQQYKLACNYYSSFWPQGKSNAVKWWRKAAEQENAKSQLMLGVCYDNGEGVAKNPAEALRWWRAAAEQGNSQAQYNVAMSYYKGKVVKQDKAEALKWFRKAADGGEAKAIFNLGVCYQNGEGVEQDKAEAVKWFRKAATSDDPKVKCAAEAGLRQIGE